MNPSCLTVSKGGKQYLEGGAVQSHTNIQVYLDKYYYYFIPGWAMPNRSQVHASMTCGRRGIFHTEWFISTFREPETAWPAAQVCVCVCSLIEEFVHCTSECPNRYWNRQTLCIAGHGMGNNDQYWCIGQDSRLQPFDHRIVSIHNRGSEAKTCGVYNNMYTNKCFQYTHIRIKHRQRSIHT